MNPLRADPQSFLFPLPAARNSPPAKIESGNAFSQILDQQLNTRNDAPNPAPQDRASSRASDDAARDREAADAKARSRETYNRRRDDKNAAKPTANGAAAVAKKGGAKPIPQKTETADSTGPEHPQKAAPKDAPDDSTQKSKADNAAAGQPNPADGKAGNAAPDADGKGTPDGDPNAQQQSGQSDDQPSPKPQTGDAALPDANAALTLPQSQAIAVLNLTGMPQAQPVMGTAGGTTGGKAGATSTDKSTTPAAQAALLIAAGQTAILQSQAVSSGLKFGLVIPNLQKAQGQAGGIATPPDLSADSDGTGSDSNPANTVISAAATGKTLPDSNRGPSTAAKARPATDPSAATAPLAGDLDGGDLKAAAFALAFPGSRPGAAVPTAALENDISARIAVISGAEASDDSELSAFSQYLGSGSGGSSSPAGALRQSSFITQLKESLQALPPHEQIAVQIQNAMQNGSSRMTVDLQPAELGRVEIKLDVDKDKNVSATIVADRPATLDLLQRDAKALERALQQAGLQADSGSLSFSLRDSGGQGAGQGQGGSGGGAGNGAGGNAGTAATNQPVKTDVVAMATGYVDLET
jgi:hypothetical protein